MAKEKRMTLKQAAEFLKTTKRPYSLSALKAAATGGRLRAEKIDAPLPYYLVSEADLLVWLSDPIQHKTGRKTN